MMRKLFAVLLCALFVGQVAAAAEVRDLRSRRGDNTIFMTWDQDRAMVKRATSSQRFRAHQRIELLTRLVDRKDEVVMRAVLKNVSERRRYRIDGRLIHRVFDSAGDIFKTLETREFHTVLDPGEKIIGRFTYVLGASGDYEARTNYKRI
jgi:hypothetical protein